MRGFQIRLKNQIRGLWFKKNQVVFFKYIYAQLVGRFNSITILVLIFMENIKLHEIVDFEKKSVHSQISLISLFSIIIDTWICKISSE